MQVTGHRIFYLGDLIEHDKTVGTAFQNAKLQSTNDYVTDTRLKGNSMTETDFYRFQT